MSVRRTFPRLLAFTAIVSLLVPSPATRAGVVYRKIVLSGDAASAAGAGATFATLAGYPSINDSGQVAFRATLGGALSGSSIWSTASDGSLKMAARTGQAGPGGTYSFIIEDPKVNNAGQVAFRAFTGSKAGLYIGVPGAITLAAQDGQTVATLGGGSAVLSGVADPRLNDSGQIAFGTNLYTPGSGVMRFVGAGDAVPGIAGATFQGMAAPLINNAGTVAFYSDMSGAPYGHSQALWSYQTGQDHLTMLARQGDPAPGGGGTIGSINVMSGPDTQSLSDNGAVAFNPGLYYGSAGTIKSYIVNSVTPAPGTAGTFGNIAAPPVLNSAGRVAIVGNIVDPDPSRNWDFGVWNGTPDNLQLIARQQDQAAGLPPGIKYDYNASVTMNDVGQVAMEGFLIGPGVSSSFGNANAIWLSDELGQLQLVARTGVPFDVDPGPGTSLRTPSFVWVMTETMPGDGRLHSLSDDGELVMRIDFTDGTSGIFTAAVSVPEPATGALALAATAAAVRIGSRRCRGRMRVTCLKSQAPPIPVAPSFASSR